MLQWVGSIDFKINEEADGNVLVKAVSAIIEQEREVFEQLLLILGKEKVDAIFCVAGGWAGGNAASKGDLQSYPLLSYANFVRHTYIVA